MFVALLILFVARMSAADRTWDGLGGNNNWSTTNNWDGDVSAPSANDRLFFGGTLRLGAVNNFAANTAFDAITFNSGAGGFTLSGAAITLNGGITNNESVNAQTISLGLILSTSSDIEVVSGGLLTISGVISNVVSGPVLGLTKHGAGTVRFTAVNTYTGDTTIRAGVVSVDGDATLGNGTGTLYLSGGNLTTSANRTASSDPIANPINVTADSAITTVSTAGTVDLNLSSGSFSGTAGTTLTFRNDAPSGSGLFRPRLSGGPFTFDPHIAIANGSFGTTELQSFNTNGNDQTFNGVISGNGSYRRTSSGQSTGGNTIFNAANTYSGGTVLNDGGLGFGVSSTGNPVTSGPIGTGPLSISGGLLGNQTLFASGGARVVGNPIIFTSGTSSQLTIGGANDLTLSGTIDLGSATRVIRVNNTAATVFSGVISGTGGMIKTNGGALTLSGANTYTGGTTLSQGTLRLGADNVIPDSGSFTFAGGVLDANNRTDTIGPLSLTADSTLNLVNDGTRGILTFGDATALNSIVRLNIYGWVGDGTGAAAGGDQIFVGAGTSATFLGDIFFADYNGGILGAARLDSGELVPIPEPINVALGVFGVVFAGMGMIRRLRRGRAETLKSKS